METPGDLGVYSNKTVYEGELGNYNSKLIFKKRIKYISMSRISRIQNIGNKHSLEVDLNYFLLVSIPFHVPWIMKQSEMNIVSFEQWNFYIKKSNFYFIISFTSFIHLLLISVMTRQSVYFLSSPGNWTFGWTMLFWEWDAQLNAEIRCWVGWKLTQNWWPNIIDWEREIGNNYSFSSGDESLFG